MCMCFACERSREKARQRGRRTHAQVCNSRCASIHCCSVLQCVAVCCSIPRFAQDTKAGAAPFFRFPMHNDTAVTVLVAMVAGCCSVLQCATICTRQTDRRCRPLPIPRTQGTRVIVRVVNVAVCVQSETERKQLLSSSVLPCTKRYSAHEQHLPPRVK